MAALSISIFIFLWGIWPWGKKSRSSLVLVQEASTPPAVSNDPGQADRQLYLEWPFTVRVGDTGTIRFELEAAGTGLGTDADGDTSDRGLVQVRLDLLEVAAAPPGEVSEPLRPGRPAIFQWMVQPEKTGNYQGMLWIYSRPVTDEGKLAQNRDVLSAQRIAFRSVSLIGLSGPQARTLGVCGAVLGLLVAAETLLTGFGRNRRKKTPDLPTF